MRQEDLYGVKNPLVFPPPGVALAVTSVLKKEIHATGN